MFFIVSFSIKHMYGCAGLLHWVYVLERVRMGTSFWDSILVYILGKSMTCPFDFYERCKRPFFRISKSLPYSSLHQFLCDLPPFIEAGWSSLTFLSLCFLLSLFYYSISLHLIWFLFFLILLDVWIRFNTHTLFLLNWYVYSFIIIFRVGILRSTTHMVSTHCISCMRGYGIISLGLLSLVSFRFFHPIALAYFTSCVLRPP